MRRRLARTAVPALLGAVLLLGAACSGDDPDPAPDQEQELSPDVVAACDEFNRVINEWSQQYGAELGEVGEAEAEGDDEGEAREEEAVESVRELFQTSADDLRAQAGATSDAELAEGLTQAADGLVEIAEQIETFEDVEAAPDLMSTGELAEGGERVNEICAG